MARPHPLPSAVLREAYIVRGQDEVEVGFVGSADRKTSNFCCDISAPVNIYGVIRTSDPLRSALVNHNPHFHEAQMIFVIFLKCLR
jgi:hypothetical protein